MIKISISGKANSGKSLIADLLAKAINDPILNCAPKLMAFADPMKQMAHLAFPQIPYKWLYGPSKLRNKVIKGAFKDGVPLTVRQLLIDIGNDFGRKYQRDIWVRSFDDEFKKIYMPDNNMVIVQDCRFRIEFDYLKKMKFFQIRVVRDDHTQINDITETDQDTIMDDEFDYIIDNNGPKKALKRQINIIASYLETKHKK